MNRLERMSAILIKLQSRPLVTAREIADQFSVSLRTVYRDIRSLEESGVPICGEAGLGYSLVEGFRLPPLMFTPEEAISFLMAEKLLSHHADDDTYDAFRGGMDKIRAVLKAAEKDFLHGLDDYIRVPKSENLPPPVTGNIMQPLLKSLLHKRQVTIEYKAGYNQKTTLRTIEPQGVFFMVHCWYVTAWCTLREDYRTFHLGRIRNINPTDEPFGRQHPSLDKLVQTLYYNTPNTKVTLRIHKEANTMIGTAKYLNGLTDERQDGDWYVHTYEAYSLERFARWYISFADKAEIVGPQELKTIVKELIDSITI